MLSGAIQPRAITLRRYYGITLTNAADAAATFFRRHALR